MTSCTGYIACSTRYASFTGGDSCQNQSDGRPGTDDCTEKGRRTAGCSATTTATWRERGAQRPATPPQKKAANADSPACGAADRRRTVRIGTGSSSLAEDDAANTANDPAGWPTSFPVDRRRRRCESPLGLIPVAADSRVGWIFSSPPVC